MELLLIALLITIVVPPLVWYLMKPRAQCPNCGSDAVNEFKREHLGMRDVNMHTGGGGGGYTSIQEKYEVSYRCGQCGETWQKIITETL